MDRMVSMTKRMYWLYRINKGIYYNHRKVHNSIVMYPFRQISPFLLKSLINSGSRYVILFSCLVVQIIYIYIYVCVCVCVCVCIYVCIFLSFLFLYWVYHIIHRKKNSLGSVLSIKIMERSSRKPLWPHLRSAQIGVFACMLFS